MITKEEILAELKSKRDTQTKLIDPSNALSYQRSCGIIEGLEKAIKLLEGLAHVRIESKRVYTTVELSDEIGRLQATRVFKRDEVGYADLRTWITQIKNEYAHVSFSGPDYRLGNWEGPER